MIKKGKKNRDLGSCRFCGSPVREYSYGWGCSNKDCHTSIYRDDKFFCQVLKKSMSKSRAVTLLTGGKVHLTNVNIHGQKIDMDIGLNYDRSGVYENRYTMNYLNYDFKLDENFAHDLDSGIHGDFAAFDILNGD